MPEPDVSLDDFMAQDDASQTNEAPMLLDDFEAGKKEVFLRDRNMIVEAPPETSDEELSAFIDEEVYSKDGGRLLGTIAGLAGPLGTLVVQEPVRKAGWNALKGAGAFFARIPGIAGSLIQEEGERMGEGPTIRQALGGGPASLFDTKLSPIDRHLMSKKFDPILGGITNAWLASRVLSREIADRTQQDERIAALGAEIRASNTAWIKENNIQPDAGYEIPFDIGGAGASLFVSLGAAYATRNPGMVGVLFGAMQKGELYEEARAAGKSPEEAGRLSTAGGIAEGALEGLGLEVFMNTLRGSKTIARIALRSFEESLQEAAQTGAEETIAKLGWDRPGTKEDIAKRILYSAAIGFIVGAPAASVATALENRSLVGELRRAGMNDKEAVQFMTTITEKMQASTAENVIQEIRLDVSPDARLEAETEAAEAEQDERIDLANDLLSSELPPSPAYSVDEAGNLTELEPEESGAQYQPDEVMPEKPAGESPVVSNEETEETITPEENEFLEQMGAEPDAGDTSFDFGQNAASEEQPAEASSGFDEFEARQMQQAEEAIVRFWAKKDFIERVGKFRRFRDKYLHEELAGISRMFFTTKQTAEKLDEVADRLGMTFNELIAELTDISKTWKKDVAAFREAKSYLLSVARADMAKTRSLNAKILKLKKYLRSRAGLNYKRIVRESTGQVDRSVLISEMKALKAGMAAQVRAATAAERSTKKGLKDLKEGLVDTINQYVPPAQRGRFLTLIAKAQSGAEIDQAAGRIERIGKELQSKEIIAYMKRYFENQLSLQDRQENRRQLRNLKAGIVETIKKYIEPSAQGRFLSLIAKAQSGADILRAANRIEKVAEELHRKELVADIKKALERAEESKSIAIEYIGKIRDLVDGFDLTKRTAKTIKKLVELRKFIERKQAAGEDVVLPALLLEKLEILSATPLNDISTQSLENVLSGIYSLIEAGKMKLATRQAVYELQKQRELRELATSTKQMTEKDIITPKIGERLTREQVMQNTAAKMMNWAMRLDLSITPMDVVFDMLDGVAGYQGANFRIFKKTIDDAYSRYIVKKDEVSKEVTDLAEELKLDDADFEAIGFHASREQEGGADKLEAMGYSKKEIDAVKLNDKQKKLYDLMRAKLDALRPDIAEVMRVVYNEELGEVKNYFPFMTDFDAMSDSEIRERFGNSVEQFGQAPKKNVQKGFTKKRVGGAQRLKLNAMEIFLGHTDNAAYLVTIGKETKRLGEIAASPEYAKAAGELGQEVVRDWIDIVARKGKMQGHRDNILDWARRQTGAATLGFKLSSALIQPTALLDGAALIGHKAFEGAQLIATSKEWREFVLKNMPEIKERIGDDVAFTEFGKKDVLSKVQRTGFWALRKLDALTASSVAVGAYIKFIEEKQAKAKPDEKPADDTAGGTKNGIDLSKPDAEAISYAQKMVRRTQASSFFKDAPSALTRGTITNNKSVDRLILQFQTFMLNRWSLIKHDAYRAGIKGENKAQAVNIAAYLTLAAIAESGLRRVSNALINGLTGDDDDDDKKEAFGSEVVKRLLSNIPFVSSAIGFSQYGSIPIPTLSMIQKIGTRAQAAARSKKKSTKLRNVARFWTMLAGWIFGLPGTIQADELIKKSAR